MVTYTDRSQMDERYERTVVQLLESQAYRELAAAQDYLDDIKPAVKACGLAFPTPREMGLEMPEWIDWSLDGVEASNAGRWQAPARLAIE